MTKFINEIEINALIEKRNDITLAIENLLKKEIEMKGHKLVDEDIEFEMRSLYEDASYVGALEALITTEYVLKNIYFMVESGFYD